MALSDRDYMRGRPPRRPPSVGPTVRVLVAVAVIGIAFFVLRPGHGSTLELNRAPQSTRWPHGVVPFYNAAADQQWAVDQAVSAWNASGASVRFVPVAPQDADLVIKDYGAACHPGAEATVGRVPHATVWLPRLDQADGACNQYSVAVFAAHELGHVLGLTHQLSSCAAMNPAGNYRGPQLCTPAAPGFWWCGLLEPDDVARAVQLYGGTALPRRQQYCQLYPPPAAPSGLTASAVPGGLEFRFGRPLQTAIPAFVNVSPASQDTLTSSFHRGACAASETTRYRWSVPVGGTMTLAYHATPGTYCFSVSAWDRTGQRGPAASYRVALR
jgi:Matrixin